MLNCEQNYAQNLDLGLYIVLYFRMTLIRVFTSRRQYVIVLTLRLLSVQYFREQEQALVSFELQKLTRKESRTQQS